ncbi:MAG: TatD family hydrolase [Enterococcus sp.]
MLTDAHCHFDEQQSLAKVQQELGMLTIVNCSTKEEWAKNQQAISKESLQVLSFGIHPWAADQMSVAEVRTYLNQAPIIGEIGLDTVWSEVPLAVQRLVFQEQLILAKEQKKPVVLHTKGCEQEILATIKKFPNRYLVHWYSTTDWQQEYIDFDCYFTIGIDVKTNPAVAQLARSVPLNRLLVESDGLAAIEWAQNRPISVSAYPMLLKEQLTEVAKLRNLPVAKLTQIIYQNLCAFLAPR